MPAMQALVLTAPHRYAVTEVPRPEPGREDVLVRVDTTYICGTDPHIIAGDFPGFWPRSYPFVPGHEWAGTVTAAGEVAAGLGYRAGDRVCATSHCGCGFCRMCLTGRYNLCLNYGNEAVGHRQYGHYTAGGYAEYVAASVKSVHRIPDRLPLACAAAIDPLAIALYTVKRTRLQPGADLVILGTGPQGLLAILCAGALGAGRIIAAGSGARLERARALGAVGIDYHSADVVAEVRRLTGGLGAPHVVECAGTAAAFRQACELAAKGGVISAIGLPAEDAAVPVRRLVLDEVEIRGGRANPNTAEEALALVVNGRLDLTPLFTHRFALSDFEQALRTFTGRVGGAVKVAVCPGPAAAARPPPAGA